MKQVVQAVKGQKGYTLIEMVIAMGVFAVLIVAVVGTLVSVSRTSRKTTVNRTVQQEVRYTLEGLAREIRQASINYDFYRQNAADPRCAIGGRQTLAITTLAADITTPIFVFYYYDNTAGFETLRRTVSSSSNPGCAAVISGANAQIVSPNVRLEGLSFFVAPNDDPLSQAVTDRLTRSTHPRVTVTMRGSLLNASSAALDRGTVTSQTTISTRVYSLEVAYGQVQPTIANNQTIIYGRDYTSFAPFGGGGPGSGAFTDAGNRSAYSYRPYTAIYTSTLSPGSYNLILSYKNHFNTSATEYPPSRNLHAPVPPYTYSVRVSFSGGASGAVQILTLSPANTLSTAVAFTVTGANPTISIRWQNDGGVPGQTEAAWELNQIRVSSQ